MTSSHQMPNYWPGYANRAYSPVPHIESSQIASSSSSSLQSLCFHEKVSPSMKRSSDGSKLKAKFTYFGSSGGLSFSHRSVQQGEVLCIEVRNLALMIGYTTVDPSLIMSSDSPPNSWRQLDPNSLVFSAAIPKTSKQSVAFVYNSSGDINVQINGVERAAFYHRVPPGTRVWAVLDAHTKDQRVYAPMVENKSFKSSQCVACFEAKPDGKLNGCGHIAMCYPCATQWLSTNRSCPVCRVNVTSVILERKRKRKWYNLFRK